MEGADLLLTSAPALSFRVAKEAIQREATLVELVNHYFADGYDRFQSMCRAAFDEIMPEFASPIVPWDEIVSERSWHVAGDTAKSEVDA